MRLSTPRIQPLPKSEWTDEQRESLEPRFGRSFYNAIGTVARHWSALKKFDVWTSHVMGRSNTLSPRNREILILRTGWLCRSGYECAQHAIFAAQVGMTDEEIAAIKVGAAAHCWSKLEKLLINAADELFSDQFISDKTWSVLADSLTQEQLMDVVFSVGQYTMVSMALNTFGVQYDEGVKEY